MIFEVHGGFMYNARMNATKRQRLFAEYYASGSMTGTAAARLAGYKNPDRYSYVLKRHDKVQALIALIHLQEISAPDCILAARLARQRELAIRQGRLAEAVAAEVKRGRLLGVHRP
jgi:phage terminase small subunit